MGSVCLFGELLTSQYEGTSVAALFTYSVSHIKAFHSLICI